MRHTGVRCLKVVGTAAREAKSAVFRQTASMTGIKRRRNGVGRTAFKLTGRFVGFPRRDLSVGTVVHEGHTDAGAEYPFRSGRAAIRWRQRAGGAVAPRRDIAVAVTGIGVSRNFGGARAIEADLDGVVGVLAREVPACVVERMQPVVGDAFTPPFGVRAMAWGLGHVGATFDALSDPFKDRTAWFARIGSKKPRQKRLVRCVSRTWPLDARMRRRSGNKRRDAHHRVPQ
mmetsp:Transcript_148/g.561  ORF Transcript_148/g.561 Transcript_148/m.561 type:complete len:230 (-) Transcript_148:23-712(-)